jgi:ribosome-binding factor A
MSERMLQVNSLLMEKLGEIFSQILEMPTEFFITISKVDTSSDLKTAKINLSVFPHDKSEDGLVFVIRHKRLIQKELGKRIKLKYTPKLFFSIDNTEEKVDQIYRLMDEE